LNPDLRRWHFKLPVKIGHGQFDVEPRKSIVAVTFRIS
jgi:hypothetical protein